ncbi:AAA family ATPase [Paenibacillus medicaginis]|uniref:AAA family ATPase n=1 Tax=Paenibacillus medicaginis TaxID=1470560 RepID=A0ABV5BUW7_9BACL
MNDIIETILVPEKCLYPNPASNYYIYACSTDDPSIEKNTYNNVSIKGNMQRLDIGVPYKAQIQLAEFNPRYGASYNVLSIYQDIPEKAEDQKDYLKAILTDLQVEAIYNTYPNENIIELFKEGKFDYTRVKGFGEVIYERARKKILENLEFQELFSYLGKYGVTYDTIKKLMIEFGSAQIAIQKITECPYELIRVQEIGFKKADAIARNMGIPIEDPYRIQYGIKHVIGKEQTSGHTYIKYDDLIKRSKELLQVTEDLIENQVFKAEGLYIAEDRVALESTFKSEKSIAEILNEMLNKSKELKFDPEKFIVRMEEKYKNVLKNGLSDQQKLFFHNIKKYNVNALVGFAGCGKSMLQKLLKDLLFEIGLTAKWLSPTGKAAKILSNYTEEKAYTIHKAIGYGMDKKEKDMIEITEDFIIIDETSMVDVFLLSMLLKKIKNPSARILFIGDSFQIPSVFAGNVLHDIIESKIIPITKLDIVFRQNEGGILDIATKIRKGEKFIDNEFFGKIMYGNNLLIHSVKSEHMTGGYKHYYTNYLEKYSIEDIMTLSPTKKGDLGTVTINKTIQDIVNLQTDASKELEFGEDSVFRIGDYVINTKNTYDILNMDNNVVEIVNGDTGKILDIVTDWKPIKSKNSEDEFEQDGNGIVVDFDFDVICIPLPEKLQLLHAWCLTMHKSQGSSGKAVLIVMDKAHKYQLNANLLYTAITRSVDYCIILCQADVINQAMRKVENLRRNTFLCELLRKSKEPYLRGEVNESKTTE